MKLRNEIVVAAPLDRTWATLLDVPRVARALPGATVEPDGVEGAYRGELKVRLGPVTVHYEGVARLQDVDEDGHSASFAVHGRERRGHGGATATIVSKLVPEDARTRVLLETELEVTGRAAQFGRGLMEEVAGRLLAEFATRLEQDLAGVVAPRPAAAEQGEALEVAGAVWRPLLRRYGWALAAGAGALLIVAALRRRVVVVVIERR